MPSGLDSITNRKANHLTNRDPSGSTQALYRLSAPIKDYAWGSTTLLADLTGAPRTTTPQAEMWFGTHPTTPTRLDDGRSLADLADLPYLVKLLAAEQPLSIQAHPTIAQAQAGFAAENAAGIPLDDPERTYRDANHKPEMLVALTDFTALAGFRDPKASAETFTTLAQLVDDAALTATLQTMAHQLAQGKLKDVFGQLVDTDGPFWQPAGWTQAIFTAVETADVDDENLRNALAAAHIHPDDPGALVTLLMNLTHLAPGEAIFVPDGTIHAYVSGLGLEIMATSDNVIRGGLTVKHIDIDELDRVVSYSPSRPPLLSPTVKHHENVLVTQFDPPVEDFDLNRYDVPADSGMRIAAGAPHVVVCTHGSGQLSSNGEVVDVSPGTGVYLPGDEHDVDLSSAAHGVTMFIASQPGH